MSQTFHSFDHSKVKMVPCLHTTQRYSKDFVHEQNIYKDPETYNNK